MSVTNPRLFAVALWGAFSCIVGGVISRFILPDGAVEAFLFPILLSANLGTDETVSTFNDSTLEISNNCQENLFRLLGFSNPQLDQVPFQDISIMIHRNGDPEPCGEARSNVGFVQVLLRQYAIMTQNTCPSELNKYQVESLLTRTFQNMLSSCPSLEPDGNKKAGFLGFCDMGPKRTPILLDHNDLVRVAAPDGKTSLPCRFHNREGLRITKLNQLTDLMRLPSTITSGTQDCTVDANGDQTCSTNQHEESSIRHLYAVPAGRVFMFAPSYVGEIFHLPHVKGADNKLIYLEVLSLEPRVFDVFNFFSRAESEDLVERAIAETKDSHRIKRSTTGASGHSVNSRRTSESGFDTHGPTAVKVKKRCFEALGFDEYWESFGDGLQILRYNVSKAYNSHLDWIEDKSGELHHDFESGGTGGNRFATILMYMSDLGPEDGGETVFPRGWPPHLDISERISTTDAINALRASDRGNVLEHGSWEEDLVAKCRTRLAVRPHSSRAVLFYSQLPNGQVDPASLHGACPVLSGQKYAANLWVWNTPRQGYPGSPIKEKFRKEGEAPVTAPAITFKQIAATFKNTGEDPTMNYAELYFEDKFWGKFGANDPALQVNTYQGHEWNVKVNGEVVKTWTILEADGEKQRFTL